ncbi:RNA-binding cell elongation regulator Jag/EloR [Limisalsivibrio acetivorans]|uniref:RNA-binding cell elongation regulator Jag/EloR n=1 Tax=Limisalsivibrio acetivorans TaxID=1304888 RepID=UPI0003B5BE50|nr:RNA-binding cell elongation regulator Jag/EloR [Limisalsivibrio acetivorans]
MRVFEIQGRTAEEAVNQFLHEKDISRDFIDYETVEAGSKGFLGIGKKDAVVRVTFNDLEYLKRKSKLLLSEMLEKAGFTDYNIEIKEHGKDIVLNVVSPDSSLLIGKTAQTLDAFQYLLDKMLRTEEKSDYSFIVDVEDYRFRTVQQFKDKAIKMAKNAVRTGRTAKLPPMVTMIRKEIHVALKKINGISTRSKGDGNVKEILIIPDKRSRRPRQNRDANRQQQQQGAEKK